MPSAFLSLHYHLVFSTKHRRPFIAPDVLPRLHEYLGGTVTGLDGVPQGIGGVAGHVHLLVGLRATHCLADFVRELKKASSAWMRAAEAGGVPEFAWQEGYAAFTVSATSRAGVRRYLANQAEHHRQVGFREELVVLLRRAKVNFEEKHLD